jgi:hypothetical protein
MTKTIPIFAVLVALIALAGCDDKARQLAVQTEQVLRQRSKELAAKTAAEVAAYQAYASLATDNQRALVAASLANDRSEQGDQLAADYEDNAKRVRLWRADLAKYRQLDYSAKRLQLLTDLDATSLYLKKYEDISIEQDKVDALDKLLITLVKEPSLKDEIASVSSFAQDTKDAFDKDVCSSLKTKKSGNDVPAKAAAQLYADKKCDEILK